MNIGGHRRTDVSSDLALLVVAALDEELDVVRRLCRCVERLPLRRVRAWRGESSPGTVGLLKVGIGPARAERSLGRFLRAVRPARILAIGYGGALAPGLAVGDLIAIERASLLDFGPGRPLEQSTLAGTWVLDGSPILRQGSQPDAAEMRAGDALTSAYIVGSPQQKQALHARFGATVVDMETALLARAAEAAGVPLACVRAISDACDDAFLAPFGYDPQAGAVGRAARVLAAGDWANRYRSWRERAARARESLGRFVASYLGERR